MDFRHFSTTIDIAATPDRVWAVIRDVERWSEWTASIKSIRLLDNGPFAVGSRAMVRQPKVPPALWTVTAIDDHSFTWRSAGPGVWAIARHSVVPVGDCSRATLSIEYGGLFGGLVGRLTGGLNDRYLGLEAAGLKKRSEESAG